MKRILLLLRQIKLKPVFLFYAVGISSSVWFLVRVIPKPSRASYPCMKAAAPLMSGFILYLLGVIGSAYAFKKVKRSIAESRYWQAFIFIMVIGVFSALMVSSDNTPASANPLKIIPPPDGANHPMGIGKGVYPGRVIWAWNKLATDSTCINAQGNRYYLLKNFNQKVIDQMVSSSIIQLTGAANVKVAWDSLFIQQNLKKYSIRSSYTPGESIFIKINQTNASWNSNSDYSDIDNNIYSAATQTSPPVVMAILEQLIDSFGVAEEDIYIGDPISHIYKYNFDYWHSAYPNVKYCDQSTANNRTRITPSGTTDINFSDQGSIMTNVNYADQELYAEMVNANYMINAACLKAHVRAGITLCAKNHFGSPIHSGAGNFHPSLVNTGDNAGATDNADNTGYKKYRVQVDLLGSQYLGGNTILSLVEGLWGGGPNEIETPVKWKMAPFNNHWTNSVFMSIDAVALESVCFDFLRTEFNGVNQSQTNPNWYGVDDYLHQAADSANWPKGIVYDPDASGTPIQSLGVHEHWSDAINKSYSRNLNKNTGIELVSIPSGLVHNVIAGVNKYSALEMQLRNYPNPFVTSTQISYYLQTKGQVSIGIYDLKGKLVSNLVSQAENAGAHNINWNGENLSSGMYICRLKSNGSKGESVQSIKIQIAR